MRFEALDAWRGLAALMVALLHLNAAGWFYGIPAIRHGVVAVPLFFVLSGFVIHHAYGDRLGDATTAWRFVVRRFGWLYPLHLFTLGAMVGLELVKLVLTQNGVAAGQAPFTGASSLENLAAQLVLMQAVIPFGYYAWNTPSWSISVEWAAYLVFAVPHAVFHFHHLDHATTGETVLLVSEMVASMLLPVSIIVLAVVRMRRDRHLRHPAVG